MDSCILCVSWSVLPFQIRFGEFPSRFFLHIEYLRQQKLLSLSMCTKVNDRHRRTAPMNTDLKGPSHERLSVEKGKGNAAATSWGGGE